MAPRPRPIHWRALICLTLIAGALRFAMLDRPAIWGDEAASWRRISGTYQQLVDELRVAGFQPAHYELTWWIKEGFPYAFKYERESDEDARDAQRPRGRGFWQALRDGGPANAGPRDVLVPTARVVDGGLPVTPLLMRFVPALCGTMLVPAIYFLAAQLVARRTALLVAIFTTFSAYQLGYSRDAKMYEQFWSFATLHVACLLWWLSAYHRPMLVEPPPPPTFDEFPRQRELGLGVSGVLSGEHVGHIARAFTAYDVAGATPAVARLSPPATRLDTTVRWACWVTTGLAMIAFHAVGLGIVGVEVLVLLATAPQRAGLARRMLVAAAAPFAFAADEFRVRRLRRHAPALSYAAPRADYDARDRLAARLRGFAIPPVIGFALGASAIVGLWWSYHDFTRFYDRVTDTDSAVQFDVGDAGIEWVEEYNRGRSAAGHFLANAGAYLLDWEWPKPTWGAGVEPRTLDALTKTATALLVAIACGVVPWRAAWARLWSLRRRWPRRLRRRRFEPTFGGPAPPPPPVIDEDARASRDRGPMPLTALLIVAAWLIVPTFAFYTASGAWKPDGGPRTRAATPTQAIVSAFAPGAYNDAAKSLAGALSVDVAASRAAHESWPALRDRLARRPWHELFVVHNVDLLHPARPWLYVAILVGGLLFAFTRRGTWRSRVALTLAGVGVIALLYGLALLTYVATPVQPRSVWMPRYLGFIWPAFAIAVCVLLRRLPIAPLRWLVIAALLAANVANFVARLRVGEPPTARMADDVVRAVREPASKVYLIARAGRLGMGTPGSGSIVSMPSAFYVAGALRADLSPRAAQQYEFDGVRPHVENVRDAADLARRLRGDPKTTDLTLWAELPVDATPANDALDKELTTALAPTWTRADEPERQTIYDHWTWKRLYVVERHRWTRAPAAATRPTVAPATRHALTRPSAGIR